VVNRSISERRADLPSHHEIEAALAGVFEQLISPGSLVAPRPLVEISTIRAKRIVDRGVSAATVKKTFRNRVEAIIVSNDLA
jgi:hypothetical protein